MFHDAICLRYNFALKLVARTCVCGEDYTINHCLTCKKGGYVILRHNSLRDLIAEILDEVCSDVEVEPPLLPLTGEKLPKGSITSPGARNLWSPLAKAFIDVRVFNPQAKANWEKSIPQKYKSHEDEKKQGYLPRVLQVEKGTFTLAVFSTSGGMGKEADRLLRRMAERCAKIHERNFLAPSRGYHSNARKHFKINSSIKSLLHHSRNIQCRKFQGSNSKTLVEDSFLRLKNSVLR